MTLYISTISQIYIPKSILTLFNTSTFLQCLIEVARGDFGRCTTQHTKSVHLFGKT